MGIFSNPYKPKPDKFSRGALLARYNKGRLALLLLAAGTLFNALMDRWTQSAGTGTGMPYGALLPYLLMGFDLSSILESFGLSGSLVRQAGSLSLLAGAALLGLYALCWYISKDHAWGMVAGLVLLSLDSLVLLFFILAGGPQALIWTLADCAIHIWLLVWVIRALRALSMRKFMKPEEAPPED